MFTMPVLRSIRTPEYIHYLPLVQKFHQALTSSHTRRPISSSFSVLASLSFLPLPLASSFSRRMCNPLSANLYKPLITMLMSSDFLFLLSSSSLYLLLLFSSPVCFLYFLPPRRYFTEEWVSYVYICLFLKTYFLSFSIFFSSLLSLSFSFSYPSLLLSHL